LRGYDWILRCTLWIHAVVPVKARVHVYMYAVRHFMYCTLIEIVASREYCTHTEFPGHVVLTVTIVIKFLQAVSVGSRLFSTPASIARNSVQHT